MGLNRKNSGAADALSKATTFSGLPKIIRVHASATQGPLGVNVWQPIQLDVTDYNYGGYVLAPRGGFNEIVVPEPGIYVATLATNLSLVSANGMVGISTTINNSGPSPTGLLNNGTDTNATSGVSVSGPLQLGQGDTVGMVVLNNVAASALALWTWMTLMKQGGQY